MTIDKEDAQAVVSKGCETMDNAGVGKYGRATTNNGNDQGTSKERR